MKTQITQDSVKVWINANETLDWCLCWPCSGFSYSRIFAEFDSNGLLDYTIDGKNDTTSIASIDGNALSAICADFLKDKLPTDHPAYDIAVGQFQEH